MDFGAGSDSVSDPVLSQLDPFVWSINMSASPSVLGPQRDSKSPNFTACCIGAWGFRVWRSMGRRKERRLAAMHGAGRRVKLDLFAEPSGNPFHPLTIASRGFHHVRFGFRSFVLIPFFLLIHPWIELSINHLEFVVPVWKDFFFLISLCS